MCAVGRTRRRNRGLARRQHCGVEARRAEPDVASPAEAAHWASLVGQFAEPKIEELSQLFVFDVSAIKDFYTKKERSPWWGARESRASVGLCVFALGSGEVLLAVKHLRHSQHEHSHPFEHAIGIVRVTRCPALFSIHEQDECLHLHLGR